MSFVCPQCGFKDSPCWRTCNFRRYSMIARIGELEVWEPEHTKTILEAKGKWVFIAPYWYKHSLKSGMVNRTTEGMGVDEWKTHGFTEKPKDPFQKKMTEVFFAT